MAGERALAGVDVAIVERRASQDLIGPRAGRLHSRTIEVPDKRGITDRCVSQRQVHKLVHFHVRLDVGDFPARHNRVLGLWQNHIERILADWAPTGRRLGADWVPTGCRLGRRAGGADSSRT